MRRAERIIWRLTAIAATGALAACSTNLSLGNVTKPDPGQRKPDWASYSGGRNDFELRPITAADLVNPEGACTGEQTQGFAEAGITGGISLQMTECDVVRRAGPVDKIDFGVNDRGERAVVITYARGPWPGIYNFTGGRLVSIERAPAPPAPLPKSQQKGAKKPAGS
jgi:hypothetical protein